MPTTYQGLLLRPFYLKVKDYLKDSVRMIGALLLMPEPHHQDQ